MIEEQQNFFQIEEKFLVVLDSKIPSRVGNSQTQNVYNSVTQAAQNNIYSNKSDLIFDLQIPIIKQIEDIQLKCSVKNGIFPNSTYNINYTNSYFAIALIDDTQTPIITGNISMTIPQGNYNTESLRIKMQDVINTQLVSNGFNDVTFSITYDNITNKYSFEMVSSNSYYLAFYISFQAADIGTISGVSQLGDVIGFFNDFKYFSGNKISTLSSNAIFSYQTKIITASFISNLSGLRAFNVILKNYNTSSINIIPSNSQIGYSNSIINGSYNNSLTQQFNKNNVICNISCNCNPMEYIFYEKQDDFFIELKEPIFSRIHIQLADNLGNLLDLNNCDWSMTLEFSLLKKKDYKTKSFYEILQSARF